MNEIVASGSKGDGAEVPIAPHAGGIANPNQTYFSTAMIDGKTEDGSVHPKHFQAQNFLSAFAGTLFCSLNISFSGLLYCSKLVQILVITDDSSAILS